MYEHSASEHGQAVLNSGVVILVVTLVHGTAAWGIFRRHLWGYFGSLILCVYWIVNSAHDFFVPPPTAAPRWFSSIPFVLNVAALIWLASPALRSQFVPITRSKKVVTPC